MAERRLLTELKQLSKQSDDAQVLRLEPTDDLLRWDAVIAKPTRELSEYYYKGQWNLTIEVPTLYPMQPPKISFARETPVAHPNIDIKSGEICLDILKLSGWSPAWNLHHLVVAILMLLDDPEPDLPLNIDMAMLYRSDKVAYKSMCQYTMWKYNTFFQNGAPAIPKDISGFKNLEVSTRTEDDLSKKSEQLSEAVSSAIHQIEIEASTLTDQAESTIQISERVDLAIHQIQAEATKLAEDEFRVHIKRPEQTNHQIVHDVGAEVKESFLAKVNATHSKTGSEELSGDDLDSVKQRVSESVSKQVEEICLKSPTPGAISSFEVHPTITDDSDTQRVKTEFLRQVDEQVQEVKRKQLALQQRQAHDLPTLQPTSSLSSSTSGSSMSKLKRSMSLKGKSKSKPHQPKADEEVLKTEKKRFARLRNSLK